MGFNFYGPFSSIARPYIVVDVFFSFTGHLNHFCASSIPFSLKSVPNQFFVDNFYNKLHELSRFLITLDGASS